MTDSTSDNAVHWRDDGSSANNPCPDWWQSSRLDSIGGRLIYTDHDTARGGAERREVVEDAGRLVELAGRMGVSDEALEAALRYLDTGGAS